MWRSKHEIFQKHDVREHEMFQKRDVLENEMFQKSDVENMKCFRDVFFEAWKLMFQKRVLKTWNVSEIWRSKYEIFQKRDVLKNEMFQKCDVESMKCFRDVLFKAWKLMFQKQVLKN